MSQYYLVVRPISCDKKTVEPYIKPLSEVLSIDSVTLRQKFLGSALHVLRAHKDKKVLEEIQGKLKKDNLPSIIVGKDELKRVKKPVRVSSFDMGKESLNLISSNSNVTLSLNGTQPSLIVLSCIDVKKARNKRVAGMLLQNGKQFSSQETVSHIMRNHPIMDIYASNYDSPGRIDSFKFNYNSLGKYKKDSTPLNASEIVKAIRRFSSETLIESGFADSSLNFLQRPGELSEEAFLREFSVYSCFILLAYRKGLFRDTTKKKEFALNDIGGIFFCGSIIPSVIQPTSFEEKNRSEEKAFVPSQESTLTPPPISSTVYRPGRLSTWSGGFRLLSNIFKSGIRSIGAPKLMYPIITTAALSLNVGYMSKKPEVFLVGVLLVGVIFLIHAFVLLKRKRAIENCPTSKIRSMPMGEVEINGYARAKYFLKSPYTFTDCVYYSYKVYEKRMTSDGVRKVLVERGSSGFIPFYLEDKTGKILILPEGAVLKAGFTQNLKGELFSDILGASHLSSNDKVIVETVIPTGQFLYVMGFAHRFIISAEEKKKDFVSKLRNLKKDGKLMEKYDINHDGEISMEEWELARKNIEKEMFEEKLFSKKNSDDVGVGKHPAGEGLFYISDKQEENIIRSFGWKTPVFLVLGTSVIIMTVYFFYVLANNPMFFYKVY